jgi:HD-like signal output (HDOD) protein
MHALQPICLLPLPTVRRLVVSVALQLADELGQAYSLVLSGLWCAERGEHVMETKTKTGTETTKRDIEGWVQFLSESAIPVMRQTVRSVATARENIDKVNARDISSFIIHDPLMTLCVLEYIRPFHGTRHLQEITTVGHAILMLGVNPFFKHFEKLTVIEDTLKSYPQAQLRLLQVIKRAQRASRYAYNWATWRYDRNTEEIMISALLRDVAEILLTCFAPQESMQIQVLQKANPQMRSATAQRQIFGFPIVELQMALCTHWKLPELLLKLMDEEQADEPRVKTVKLAVDLARHSANGWEDAALPDDYIAIESLLKITHDDLMVRLGLKEASH